MSMELLSLPPQGIMPPVSQGAYNVTGKGGRGGGRGERDFKRGERVSESEKEKERKRET